MPGSLGELDVTSAAGTVTVGDTVIAVDPSSPSGTNKYVYKLGTAYASFSYDSALTTGWIEFDSGDTIAAGSSTKITVAEITSDNKARARGIAILQKKTS